MTKMSLRGLEIVRRKGGRGSFSTTTLLLFSAAASVLCSMPAFFQLSEGLAQELQAANNDHIPIQGAGAPLGIYLMSLAVMHYNWEVPPEYAIKAPYYYIPYNDMYPTFTADKSKLEFIIDASAPPDATFVDPVTNTPTSFDTYPVTAFGFALGYNLKGDDGQDIPNLVVPQEAIPLILWGEITHWDDPALKQVNPGVSLPNRPIKVVHRADNSQCAVQLSKILVNFNSSFAERIGSNTAQHNYCSNTSLVNGVFPDVEFVSGSNVKKYVRCKTTGFRYIEVPTLEMQVSVLSTEKDSVGIIPLTASTKHIPLTAIRTTLSKQVLTANLTTMTYAQMEKGVNKDKYLRTELLGSQYGWPMTGFLYFIIRKDSHSTIGCRERSNLYRFLKWWLRSDQAKEFLINNRFSPLVETFALEVVTKLEEGFLVCGCDSQNEGQAGKGTCERVSDLVDPTLYKFQGPQLYRDILSVTLESYWNTRRIDNAKLQYASTSAKYGSAVAVAEGTTAAIVNVDNYEGEDGSDRLRVPFLEIPVGILYCLPGTTASLNVTEEIFTKILKGEITQWNDRALLAINPLAAATNQLPNKKIIVVDRLGQTEIGNFMADRGYEATAADLKEYGVSSELDVLNMVMQTPYSIAYWVPVMYVPDNPVKFAKIIDKNNQVIDRSMIDEWPLVIRSMLELSPKISGNCKKEGPLFDTLRFIGWIYEHTDTANIAFRSVGAYLAGQRTDLDSLLQVRCNGQSILAASRGCGRHDMSIATTSCNPRTQSHTAIFSWTEGDRRTCYGGDDLYENTDYPCDHVALGGGALPALVIAIAALGIVTCLVLMGWTYIHRHTAIIVMAQRPFCYSFLLAAILLNVSSLTFIGANTDSSCLLRPWAFHLSSTLMYGTLFMKLLRVQQLFNNPQLKRKAITNATIAVRIISVISIDILLLVLWSAISTPEAVDTDVIVNTFHVTMKTCGSKYHGAFTVLMAAWKAILVGSGCYFAKKSWDIDANYSEAKHMAIALYNSILLGAITFAMQYSALTAPSYVVLQTMAIMIAATGSAIMVMGPKLYYLYKNPSARMTRKTGSGGGATGQASGTQQGGGSSHHAGGGSSHGGGSVSLKAKATEVVPAPVPVKPTPK